MKLSVQAVDRPRIVIVASCLVILMAIYAVTEIAVQREPAISQAIVVVNVPFPGAGPEEVDEKITRKLEEVLARLDRVDWMQSYSFRGLSSTTIFFLDGVDAKRARDDVAHLINEVRPQLPVTREVQPSITDVNFQSTPIMLVSVTGLEGHDPAMLQKVAEEVRQDLETIPGVANVGMFGGRDREIQVNYDPGLLAQYGLSHDDLRTALQQADTQLPGGSLNASGFDMQVRSGNRLRDAKDIERAVVVNRGGTLIRIMDVAEVLDTYERPNSYAQLDGRACVTVVVNRDPNINTLAVASQIRRRVAELQAVYPQVSLTCTRDASAEIRQVFTVLGSSLILGGIVVAVILYFAMGLRIALLVLLAIPLSTAISLVCLYALGVPISTMVILSYILVLGMVVDGAIIVVENIQRHIERGETSEMAAKNGIREIALPVFAADVTTIAAFAPMLIIPGILGDFIGTMPKVIALALLGSVTVDHFLIPALAALWLRRRHGAVPAPRAHRGASNGAIKGHVWDPSHRCAAVGNGSRNGGGSSRAHPEPHQDSGFFTRAYVRFLRCALSRPWTVVVCSGYAIAWAGLMLGGGLIDLEFFPPSDTGRFQIRYELPLGYSVEQSLRCMEAVTDPLAELWETGELEHYVASVGPSEGLVGLWATDPAEGPEFGSVLVQLKPTSQRDRSQDEIIAQLREKIKPMPGMKYSIFSEEESPTSGSDVELRLSGSDYKRVGQLSQQLVERLQRIPGTVDVTTDYRPNNPELVVEPRPRMAALYGFTEADVSRAVATAIQGDNSIEMVLDGKDVTLRLQANRDLRRYPDDVRRLLVNSPNGRRATIGEIADVRRELGLFQVRRFNRYPAASVTCNLVSPDVDPENGTTASDLFRQLDRILMEEFGFLSSSDRISFRGQFDTPSEGIRAKYAGTHEDMVKDYAYLVKSSILAVLLVTSVLIIQFNSVRQAAIVLIAIPLSFVGVVAGMWICDFPFSLFSFIGLISLVGVVVNDAIVIVDFANRGRQSGLSVHDALIEAGRNRLRPVLLTTATTVGGMLPLLLNVSGGAEFWQPLAGAVIFGLLVSTILTLAVIPVLYSLVYRTRTAELSPALSRPMRPRQSVFN